MARKRKKPMKPGELDIPKGYVNVSGCPHPHYQYVPKVNGAQFYTVRCCRACWDAQGGKRREPIQQGLPL